MNKSIDNRVTVPSLLLRKQAIHGDNSAGGQKIVAVTAYDYTSAKLVDRAGVDMILVGDSLGVVFQGCANTLAVSLEEMIYHSKCVARGVNSAMVVADMPFMSYQVSPEEALRNAGKLIKEAGVSAVKLEGGISVRNSIRRIVEADIPVVGHVGLTPQSYHRMGGHKIQGKKESNRPIAGSRSRILEDAKAVEDGGAFCLVVEGVPSELAAEITTSLQIPVIGIGAGPSCDGQILVINDLLGLDPDFKPKFVKRYDNLGSKITEIVSRYAAEVRSLQFPTAEHSFTAAAN